MPHPVWDRPPRSTPYWRAYGAMPTATVRESESPTMRTRTRFPAPAQLWTWTACHSAALAWGPASVATAAVAGTTVPTTTTATVAPSRAVAGPMASGSARTCPA